MNKLLKFIIVLIGALAIGLFFNQPAFANDNDTERIVPFGINNPFSYPESDENSQECLQENSGLIKIPPQNSDAYGYIERHIELDNLKGCIPVVAGYMEAIKDIGVNVISQHFSRRYARQDGKDLDYNQPQKEINNGLPYFGLEEWRHRNHEVPVQLYINGYNNYFWAAVLPDSTKFFPGDIDIISTEHSYLPNSKEGFAEWQKWLKAMFDYLDNHKVTDKILYIQLGNESDADYRNKEKADPANRNDYYWSAYARLIEESYNIIRQRAPKTKIAIGAMGAESVSIDGFQRPTLEYLAGKIDENGDTIASTGRKCGGTGCFDVYDYHDFSGYKEYQGRITSRANIPIQKSPETFKKLLLDSGFPDKNLVIQQGGTYTGQDDKTGKKETNKGAQEYQTEEDQASYLVKRAVYLVSQGVEQTQFATYTEHHCFKFTIHNWFSLMGLTYNGIPKQGSVPDCHTNDPKPENFDKNTCDGQFPCSDPGKDIKKLSWFTYKKLIEIFKGLVWNEAKVLTTGTENSYVYKFIHSEDPAQNPIYVAWWDWWKDHIRNQNEVDNCKNANTGNYVTMDKCINELDNANMSKNITLNFTQARKIKITEAIPDYTTGQEADTAGYENAFSSYIKDVIDGQATITLRKRPVYIEIISDEPLVACVVKPEQTVQAGDTVYLDGSCSSDPDGDLLTYQWTQVSGTLVDLQNFKTATSSFIAPSIIIVKNKNSSFAATLVSSVSVIIEFFKSVFVDGTGTSDNDLGFQLVVTGNNKTSNAPAKVTVTPSLATTSINIVSPSDGTVFSPDSKIEIKAKAKGENIKFVYFLINDQKYKGRYDKQEDIYFFNWDIPYGYSKPYNIKAQLVAYPVKKRETIVESKPITIHSVSAPSIFIINPQNGQTVKPKQRITVEAKFSPNDIGITKVEFFIVENKGKTRKKIDTNPNKEGNYSFLWEVPNTPGTSYQIQAVSYTKDFSSRESTRANQSEMIEVRVE